MVYLILFFLIAFFNFLTIIFCKGSFGLWCFCIVPAIDISILLYFIRDYIDTKNKKMLEEIKNIVENKKK